MNMSLSRRNGKVQPANVKNGMENKVTWFLMAFTFQVNAVLNLSNQCYIPWKSLTSSRC